MGTRNIRLGPEEEEFLKSSVSMVELPRIRRTIACRNHVLTPAEPPQRLPELSSPPARQSDFKREIGKKKWLNGMTSAAYDTLKACPLHELPADRRTVRLAEEGAAYYPKKTTDFFNTHTVKESIFLSDRWDMQEATRREIRSLRRQLKHERAALRKAEQEMCDLGLGALPAQPSLPTGWFETRDATGKVCWAHRATRHTVYSRPTDQMSNLPPKLQVNKNQILSQD